MMEKETKEILKMTSFEILKRFADVVVGYSSGFVRSKEAKKDIFNYWQDRDVDKIDFSKKFYQLRRRGLIRKIYRDKVGYYEITDKGRGRLIDILSAEIVITRPAQWDGKWRIVIYDVPEKDRVTRNAIREQLYKIGFLQVQKSVFVYPFECGDAINQICNHYGERDCIKYMIAEIIEGEDSIIEKFLDNQVLKISDLKKRSKE